MRPVDQRAKAFERRYMGAALLGVHWHQSSLGQASHNSRDADTSSSHDKLPFFCSAFLRTQVSPARWGFFRQGKRQGIRYQHPVCGWHHSVIAHLYQPLTHERFDTA